MANTFLVVESPAKAKTISKYLGKGFTIKASMGHIRDLPKEKIAVDVENDFSPHFVILPLKKRTVDELKESAEKSEKILLAADPDREGEAICYHLNEIFKDADKPTKRVLFYEITEKSVKEAVNNPVDIDPHKVEAQLARRIIDRLVGYYISPLLWEKVKNRLSAGRVQSVALRMLVDRESERDAFVKEEFWVIGAVLSGKDDKPFESKLTHFKGKKAEIKNKEENDEILESLKGKPFKVASLVQKEVKKSPLPPYITSKLQQDAARMLKFPVKKTMSVAQRLYEGVDLAKGQTTGLITYMRTDSTRISPEAITHCRKFILDEYGKEFLPEKERIYAPKGKAQDAHEAIRPTDVFRTPESIKQYLKDDEYALYKLIYRRFVASQMKDALFLSTKAQIECDSAIFLAQGSICTFKGYKVAFDSLEDEDKSLPDIKKGEVLNLIELKSEQKWTEPPPRYSEATLVRALEENGIGRPSTYATIISTVQAREYVNKEGGYLVPTSLGKIVSEILVKHFPKLFDIDYTAKLEEELDKIEKGEEKRIVLLKKFWKMFSKTLSEAKEEMANIKRDGIETDIKCPKCGKSMVKKMGSFGMFLGCSDYPKCKTTMPLKEEEKVLNVPEEDLICTICNSKMVVKSGKYGQFLACEHYPKCKGKKTLAVNKEGELVLKKDELLDEKCPQCGANLVSKMGRYGKFIACSNYPECKYIKKREVKSKDLPPCPLCSKPLRMLFTKKKKPFYGCTNYPKCKFISWDEPIGEKCPQCGNNYLVKKIKGKKVFKVCVKEGCGYTEEINK